MIWLALFACRPAPPDPCEVAWAELDALRTGLAEHTPVRAPSREDFLAACAALPPEARRCLSLETAVADPGCDGAIDTLELDAGALAQ